MSDLKIIEKHSDRLKMIMEGLSINGNGLATSLGYKRSSTVYNIINEYHDAKMSSGFIEKLIEKFPQVNFQFAKQGIGEPILEGKALIAQMNVLGTKKGENMTFEEEVRGQLLEINRKLDILLSK